jgi:hypothetical protein
VCVCSCNLIDLTYLQVTRNMVLFLLFNHTHMSIVEGSSFITCTSPTVMEPGNVEHRNYTAQ